ncbi:BlaB/IND/MUS family subclass B1 metallo-beta-lactamase [Flavihumibacter sp. R14]|nr:BlaB/IND/MUS family subclass B1 metallo-beta-lactamase [Flavihumibacter soli]
MRTLLNVTLLLLVFTGSFAQDIKKLEINHLSGNFYVYTTYKSWGGQPFPANAMYLVTDKGVVLFDSPWDSTQNQPLLDSIKARHQKDVVMCIATHSHEDRTGGLDFLKKKGVKTYTTKLTDEISKVKGEPRAEFLMESDTVFTVGQHKFQTYYAGAGHTPDNIVIWSEKEKVLYGGCLIKSTEAKDLGNLADASLRDWPGTIRSIQQKFRTPRYVIPGHQGWSDKSSLDHTLKLLIRHSTDHSDQ